MNGNGDGDSGETSEKNGSERMECEELYVILQETSNNNYGTTNRDCLKAQVAGIPLGDG